MTKEYQKDWRAKNPEKAAEYSKRWREKNREKLNEYQRKWRQDKKPRMAQLQREYRARYPERYAAINRKKHLKKKWGITEDQYQKMLASQNGVCHICRRPPGAYRLSIDHCHETGVIRGLLCSRCNRAIALLWESPEILKRCVEYLDGKQR